MTQWGTEVIPKLKKLFIVTVKPVSCKFPNMVNFPERKIMNYLEYI